MFITRHQFLVTSAVYTSLILLREFYVDHSSDKRVRQMACLLFSCTGRRFFSGKPDFHQVLFVSVNHSIVMSMGKFMSKLKYLLRF